MSGYTWRLINWFKENKGASNTRLAINSNLGFSEKDTGSLAQLLRITPAIELDLYTSNESIGAHAEYIRDGLNWSQWLDNVTFLLDKKKLRGLHIMCTINALCLVSLTQFLNLIVTLKEEYGKNSISFTLNILRFPSFQSPLILPTELKTQYKEELQQFYDSNVGNPVLHHFELNHIQRLIDYLDIVKTPHSDTFDMAALHNDFKQFYTQYDTRRGKNFVATFPQLAEWYLTI
jgi:hypothetical protein